MLQLIYIGPRERLNVWRTKAQIHASFLGLNSECIQWRIKPSLHILLVTIHPASSVSSSVPSEPPSLYDVILLRGVQGKWSLSRLKTQNTLKEVIPIFDSHSLWITFSGA